MLKRLALTFTATAMFAIPATSASAVPETNQGQPLPEEACFAVYPQTVQPLLCGYDEGAPPGSGIF